MAASNEDLHSIHEKVAKAYLRILEKLDPTDAHYDSEFVPNPAVLGHINKFLQQNNIEMIPVQGSALEKLKAKGKLRLMPFLEDHERLVAGD